MICASEPSREASLVRLLKFSAMTWAGLPGVRHARLHYFLPVHRCPPHFPGLRIFYKTGAPSPHSGFSGILILLRRRVFLFCRPWRRGVRSTIFSFVGFPLTDPHFLQFFHHWTVPFPTSDYAQKLPRFSMTFVPAQLLTVYVWSIKSTRPANSWSMSRAAPDILLVAS